MNNREIEEFAFRNKYARRGFKGCMPYDAIPIVRIKRFPAVYIINNCTLDDSAQNTDICHWLALHVGPKQITIFNSAGGNEFKFLEPIVKFLAKQKKPVIYNNNQIQDYGSSVCGLYCLLFIYLMSKNISFRKFISSFHRRNFQKNDKIIKLLFNCAFLRAEDNCLKDINKTEIR